MWQIPAANLEPDSKNQLINRVTSTSSQRDIKTSVESWLLVPQLQVEEVNEVQ